MIGVWDGKFWCSKIDIGLQMTTGNAIYFKSLCLEGKYTCTRRICQTGAPWASILNNVVGISISSI